MTYKQVEEPHKEKWILLYSNPEKKDNGYFDIIPFYSKKEMLEYVDERYKNQKYWKTIFGYVRVTEDWKKIEEGMINRRGMWDEKTYTHWHY